MKKGNSDLSAAIANMRALARDALAQYKREMEDGGEPVFPYWTNDLDLICRAAESPSNLAHCCPPGGVDLASNSFVCSVSRVEPK
jgi:hypothetical protein